MSAQRTYLFKGERRTVLEVASLTGIPWRTLYVRVWRGMSMDDAAGIPLRGAERTAAMVALSKTMPSDPGPLADNGHVCGCDECRPARLRSKVRTDAERRARVKRETEARRAAKAAGLR